MTSPPRDNSELVRREYYLGALEDEFRGQLYPARPTSAEERIADANIACSNDLVGAISDFAVVRPSDKSTAAGKINVCSRIGDERGEQGIREIGMIKDVKEIRAKLNAQPFANRRGLINREIPLFEGRTNQTIAA